MTGWVWGPGDAGHPGGHRRLLDPAHPLSLPWRNLGYSIRTTLSKEARTAKPGTGDVSPFACLCTALAATIGTGNIA